MTVPVVILAGGDGSRIGGDKPLRKLGASTLLDRAIAQASEWSLHPVLSLRRSDQFAVPGVEVIGDEAEVEGPLAGLIAALRYAQRQSAATVLTIPVDMPFLPDDLLARLSAGIGEANAAIAAANGELFPVCSLWRASVLDRLPLYLHTGKRSLRGFAAHVGYVAVEWPATPVDPFFNINNAADLAAAERRLQR